MPWLSVYSKTRDSTVTLAAMKMTTHYPNKYERQAKKLLPESDCLTLIKGSSCPENVIELDALCLTLFPVAWCSSEGCQVAFQYVENSKCFPGAACFLTVAQSVREI